MKVRFWGVRGSLPTPIGPHALEEKLLQVLREVDRPLRSEKRVRQYLSSLPFHLRATYGGHTSCVEVISGPDRVILDAGSGLLALGEAWRAQDPHQRPSVHHIFLSHLHWDHTAGLPHFAPMFQEGQQAVIYSVHPGFEDALLAQHSPPNFPVCLSRMEAAIVFRRLSPGQPVAVGALRLNCLELPHPGRSFGFRVEDGTSTLVYATDVEYRRSGPDQLKEHVAFFRGADALIIDAQYDLQETLMEKRDWGHSSPTEGADLALAAGVPRLILFHHDPSSTDQEIAAMEQEVQEHLDQRAPDACQAVAAYEGLEFNL